MEINIQDKGKFLDFWVDSKHSARLEVLPDNKYLIIKSNGILHDMVLHGLFLAVMNKRG